MNTTISVKYPIIGAKVVRGKDWVYGNQDGGEGKTGVIIEKIEDNWVRVKWENDCKDSYRIGDRGMYDLYFENYKDALLQEAMERFPSGCSYANISSYDIYINVEYDYPFWYSDNQIALKYKKGLIYDNGKWAERTDSDNSSLIDQAKKLFTVNTVFSNTNLGFKCTDVKIIKAPSFKLRGGELTLNYEEGFVTIAYTIYKDGKWAERTDVPVKELSPLELCKQMYSVGDVVETTMGNETLTEVITKRILDSLEESYAGGSVSCFALKGFLYRGKTKEYAKIINKPINTNQNGEKSKSNPISNGSTNTTNVECSIKRAIGIKVQRLNFKIPVTTRTGGAGLKSSDSKVRFGSNSSYHQKRLSIS
jgi:hypothetical protein